MEILRLEGATVRFGGLLAVNNVDMTMNKGEILGLIGPNGAGKTTLFNLVTGIYTPTSGNIIVYDENINKLKPYERVEKGIARTFQNIRLIKGLSVLENVLVAHRECNSEGLLRVVFAQRNLRKQRARIVDECHEILQVVGLADKVDELAGNLPYGEQRLLEIARAMVTQCRLLLLDEPAAGMNSQEKLNLSNLIRRLSREYEVDVLLIEHDVRMVMNIADRITVLDHGEKIAQGSGKEIQSNPEVIKAYLGEEIDEQ